MGPPTWVGCEEVATVMPKVKQPGESVQDFPACQKCWSECIGNEAIIIEAARPLTDEELKAPTHYCMDGSLIGDACNSVTSGFDVCPKDNDKCAEWCRRVAKDG